MKIFHIRFIVSLLVCGVWGCASPGPADDTRAAVEAGNRGDYEEAIRRMTHAISAPNTTDATRAVFYDLRCLAYARRNQSDNALSDCNEAIRLRPDYSASYNDRATIYLQSNQYDLAIADLDVAIRLKPDDAVSNANRGFAYFRKGKYDQAISDFDSAVRFKPDLAFAYRLRGNTYLELNNTEHAIADENEAIRLAPKDGTAYDLRSIAHFVRSEFDLALTDINASIQIQPNAPGLLADRGVLELAMGRFSAAADDLERARKTEPGNAFIVLWLHVARQKVGTSDAAEFEQNYELVDQTKWPSPIIALYREQIPEAKLLELLPLGESSPAAILRCMVNFHIGEHDLIQHGIAGAKTSFRLAAETCPGFLVEKVLADTELRRLSK